MHANEVDVQPTTPLTTEESQHNPLEMVFSVRCSFYIELISTFSFMYMLIILEIIDIFFFIRREAWQRGSLQGVG